MILGESPVAFCGIALNTICEEKLEKDRLTSSVFRKCNANPSIQRKCKEGWFELFSAARKEQVVFGMIGSMEYLE